MRPFLERVDRIQGELEKANTKLVEATVTLNKMETELEVANQRLQSLDRFMKRFGGPVSIEDQARPESQ